MVRTAKINSNLARNELKYNSCRELGKQLQSESAFSMIPDCDMHMNPFLFKTKQILVHFTSLDGKRWQCSSQVKMKLYLIQKACEYMRVLHKKDHSSNRPPAKACEYSDKNKRRKTKGRMFGVNFRTTSLAIGRQ